MQSIPGKPGDVLVNVLFAFASVAGKGWFAILRLYGPLKPWFQRNYHF
jgi:hypothetical protein